MTVDPLHVAEVLDTLRALDWAGEVAQDAQRASRWVLLVDPDLTRVQPLIERLLLAPAGRGATLLQRYQAVNLGELLKSP